jgi:hypothetical protein
MSANAEMGIYFYMQATDYKGEPMIGAPIINLEEDFEGLLYSKAKGLNDKGKIKNTYSEKYADSDRVRVYFPDEPKRESTTVTFTFFFTGENRYAVFDEFVKYVSGGFRAFWDTKRKKRLVFYATDEMKVTNEMWYGSTPYLSLDLKVQNIFGETFDVE